MSIKSIKTGFTGISALAGNDQWFGDFEAIAYTTLSVSSTSVSFSSIPATYTHLQVRYSVLCTNNAPAGYLQLNDDTAGNYSCHRLYGSGSTTGSDAFTNASQIYTLIAASTSTTPGVNIIDILDYANTNKYKTVRSIGGNDNNGSGYAHMMSGSWRNTNAVTKVTLAPDAGSWAANSSFALYGIRG